MTRCRYMALRSEEEANLMTMCNNLLGMLKPGKRVPQRLICAVATLQATACFGVVWKEYAGLQDAMARVGEYVVKK